MKIIKGKNCFCSGIKRKDGSLIKCRLCVQRDLIERLKKEDKNISDTLIMKAYLEPIAYEYYDFSKNEGYIDREAIACGICSYAFQTRKECIQHFREKHLLV